MWFDLKCVSTSPSAAAVRPAELTDDLLSSFEALWEACCPDLRSLPPPCSPSSPPARDADDRAAISAEREERAPTPQSDDEGPPKLANFVISAAPPPAPVEGTRNVS